MRALDYAGAAQANVPVIAGRSSGWNIEEGYYSEPTVTAVGTATATTAADGTATAAFTLPPQSGSFRVHGDARRAATAR